MKVTWKLRLPLPFSESSSLWCHCSCVRWNVTFEPSDFLRVAAEVSTWTTSPEAAQLPTSLARMVGVFLKTFPRRYMQRNLCGLRLLLEDTQAPMVVVVRGFLHRVWPKCRLPRSCRRKRLKRDQLTCSSQCGDYLCAYPRLLVVHLKVGCLIHAAVYEKKTNVQIW